MRNLFGLLGRTAQDDDADFGGVIVMEIVAEGTVIGDPSDGIRLGDLAGTGGIGDLGGSGLPDDIHAILAGLGLFVDRTQTEAATGKVKMSYEAIVRDMDVLIGSQSVTIGLCKNTGHVIFLFEKEMGAGYTAVRVSPEDHVLTEFEQIIIPQILALHEARHAVLMEIERTDLKAMVANARGVEPVAPIDASGPCAGCIAIRALVDTAEEFVERHGDYIEQFEVADPTAHPIEAYFASSSFTTVMSV